MYAVVKIGASQYKISEGDTIKAVRLEGEEGKDITLDQVLLIGEDDNVQIGQPFVKGAKVTAKVVRHMNGEKVIAFKYRLRKDSSTKRGYRKRLTELTIKKISV